MGATVNIEKLEQSGSFIPGTISHGITGDGKLIKLVIDSITYALNTIDYAHHEVHDGNAFWAYHNATLGNAEVSTVALTTPNSVKWSHLLLEITSSAVATFDILEQVTSFVDGASFTPINFNRNSVNTSVNSCLVGHTGADVITPTGGTTIWSETLGANKIQTMRENATELILKSNTKYLFRITNGTSANNCTILLNWYEHTNK